MTLIPIPLADAGYKHKHTNWESLSSNKDMYVYEYIIHAGSLQNVYND